MKQEIASLIRENLLEIMPELNDEKFSDDDSFVELGANSIDRGELITLTLEKLNLDVPRIEFVSAQTIDQLAELMAEKSK